MKWLKMHVYIFQGKKVCHSEIYCKKKVWMRMKCAGFLRRCSVQICLGQYPIRAYEEVESNDRISFEIEYLAFHGVCQIMLENWILLPLQ